MTLLDSVSTERPPAYGLLIGGLPYSGRGPSLELTSRVDSSLIGRVASASDDDVTVAFDHAASGLSSWSSASPADRAAILMRAACLFRERAEEIGQLIAAEMGKPLGEARSEVEKGAAILEYFAQVPYRSTGSTFVTDTGEEVFTVAEPLGVVALITPWNFPLTIPIRKIAAALATGNTILFKPATNSALCGLAIGRTLFDAGLPGDTMSVIVGRSSAIEHALFGDQRLGGVSLTGSYPTAEAIRRLLPVEVPFQAELGGKNVLVIWKDANLELAVEIICQSSFRNNGQICTSSGRLLVHEDVASALLTMLRETLAGTTNSRGLEQYGVLSSESEHQKIRAVIERAEQSTREIIAEDWGDDRISPTVLVAPEDGELTEEEIFGPVVTFEVVSSMEHAIARGNRTSYGLTAGIVTNDLSAARAFWTGIRAGLVKVNAPLTGTPFHIPLRGWRHSGVGPGEGGDVSVDFFTKRKAVYLSRTQMS